MKKSAKFVLFLVIFTALCAGSAFAVVNDMVKVGIKYGSSALFSANLENAVGAGYEFGYYNAERRFISLGHTGETTISMTPTGTVYVGDSGKYYPEDVGDDTVIGPYHIQLSGSWETFDEAAAAASRLNGAYPAYLSGTYVVRVGNDYSQSAAEKRLANLGVDGTIVCSDNSGILVTVTKTDEVLFVYDGESPFGVLPDGSGEKVVTWCKGYRYYGGFEYRRTDENTLTVINVLPLEDYVKGVIPYEMSGSWPLEALKAQAICARTYAIVTTKHLSANGFDLSNGVDCQTYRGVGSYGSHATETSNRAVEETAGQCLYYKNRPIEAVYSSSDGGATEDAENVWGTATPYLIGKTDPYEANISIPNYNYSTTYTSDELTDILHQKGYSIGKITDIYISQYTDAGNVCEVTFVDTHGGKLYIQGGACKTIFYSSTYNKSIRSIRYQITGGSTADLYVNDLDHSLTTVNGVTLISGSGKKSYCGDAPYLITANGTTRLEREAEHTASDSFTISGKGSGHNVGMSQYGALAMAKSGMTSEDILHFYYTNVTIK